MNNSSSWAGGSDSSCWSEISSGTLRYEPYDRPSSAGETRPIRRTERGRSSGLPAPAAAGSPLDVSGSLGGCWSVFAIRPILAAGDETLARLGPGRLQQPPVVVGPGLGGSADVVEEHGHQAPAHARLALPADRHVVGDARPADLRDAHLALDDVAEPQRRQEVGLDVHAGVATVDVVAHAERVDQGDLG